MNLNPVLLWNDLPAHVRTTIRHAVWVGTIAAGTVLTGAMIRTMGQTPSNRAQNASYHGWHQPNPNQRKSHGKKH